MPFRKGRILKLYKTLGKVSVQLVLITNDYIPEFNLLLILTTPFPFQNEEATIRFGVPEDGVLDEDPVYTARVFIAELRAISLTLLVTHSKKNVSRCVSDNA